MKTRILLKRALLVVFASLFIAYFEQWIYELAKPNYSKAFLIVALGVLVGSVCMYATNGNRIKRKDMNNQTGSHE